MTTPPLEGICRLCLEHRELRESHLLSALVYRWFRRTQRKQANAFVLVDTIKGLSKRVQDGLRVPFCCGPCEFALGKAEHQFREKFFGLYVRGRRENLEYRAWLAVFIAANLWRILQYTLETEPAERWLSPAMHAQCERAAERWRRFLRGEVTGVGDYRLHLVELSEDFAPSDYIQHVIDYAVGAEPGTDNQFVFIKFGALLLVGAIHDVAPREWRHTAIDTRQGVWNQHRSFRVPTGVIRYVLHGSRDANRLARELHNAQAARAKRTPRLKKSAQSPGHVSDAPDAKPESAE